MPIFCSQCFPLLLEDIKDSWKDDDPLADSPTERKKAKRQLIRTGTYQLGIIKYQSKTTVKTLNIATDCGEKTAPGIKNIISDFAVQ